MIFIKKFIDRISALEGKQSRDLVISMSDARGLRDDLDRLLLDNYELLKQKDGKEQLIQVEIKGGTFK